MKWVTHRDGRSKQTLYNFSNISQAASDRDYLVCISERDWSILNAAIGNADIMSTRVFTDVRGVDDYLVLERFDANWDIFTEYIDTLKAKLMTLHCVTDIVDALKDIGVKIEQSACCGTGEGSQGTGGTDSPPSTYVDDGQIPPAGYGTYAEYDNEKCQVAQKILDDLDADLTVYGSLSIAGMVASGLAATFLTPIPFDDLLALAAAGVAWLTSGVLTTYTAEIASSLSTNATSARCALYNATTPDGAINDLKTALGLSSPAENLLGWFMTYDSVNRLFTYVDVGDYGANCVDCGPCSPVVKIGSDLGGGVYQAVYNSSDNRYWVQVDWERAGTNCGVTLTQLDTSIPISAANSAAYRLYSVTGSLIYSSQTPPALPMANVHAFNLTDIPGDPFTVTVSYTES